ncbi:hypothetical protein JCM8097_004262 [Rhodosporidiobolus ruineniae]
MFTQVLVALAAASLAQAAELVPLTPVAGQKVGGTCKINWNLDTTGTWTNFSITLKTGPNLNMVALETVQTGIDGTTGTGELDWTCPDVTPNSDIYFYEFAQEGADVQWTTRFAIAATDGTTTEPTNETDGVQWGTGQLVGASFSGSSSAASGSSRSASAAAGASSSSTLAASSASSSAAASSSSSAAVSTADSSSSTEADVVTVTSTSSASSQSQSASQAAASANSNVTTDNSAAGVKAGFALGFVGAAIALFA